MRDVSIRRIFLAWTVACVSLTLGCGSKLEGTYINATGQVAIRVSLTDGRQLILRADPVD